ncbi:MULTISPECIES: hypothetical protein [Antrihabitans]|uniref:Uncharacterized protein n=2 Tax=Antrihabitans TaxID=2799491 RepID=A0A934U2L6_9NOCA|nr:hypothetical protein [Antrihabitans stalagmiti]MBJ8339284.1 hypothetical protein [Antrihabitans stalagmiti]
MARKVHRSAAIVAVAMSVMLALSGCSKQEKDFRKQLEQAGFSVSDVRSEKASSSKTKTKSKKRPKKSSNKKVFEADVKLGNCLVEFEQGEKEKRYYLDEVNNDEPVIGLMKDNPTKADVEAYLRGPDSPCKL